MVEQDYSDRLEQPEGWEKPRKKKPSPYGFWDTLWGQTVFILALPWSLMYMLLRWGFAKTGQYIQVFLLTSLRIWAVLLVIAAFAIAIIIILKS